mmetsp:Transcript_36705/g.84836  ORF Transcript_36705/g.84836 Transcript_36705/m.84836 type:complete len:521 (-) Transcript_36705:104-1666(-)|eukprot:CAMPEP_0182563214 /NCGR_PEP_ID=MMETSP1324-20130603/5398_1 /TAXON_ID=236786 /ORGANISM="Florenciella sp., Strain RCC1587" /LENGTH=520 /DNA_ID=CAMNT_0024776349 /DNA_START=46 /DNA_END=1608 /DNA_ORIENTATION=-
MSNFMKEFAAMEKAEKTGAKPSDAAAAAVPDLDGPKDRVAAVSGPGTVGGASYTDAARRGPGFRNDGAGVVGGPGIGKQDGDFKLTSGPDRTGAPTRPNYMGADYNAAKVSKFSKLGGGKSWMTSEPTANQRPKGTGGVTGFRGAGSTFTTEAGASIGVDAAMKKMAIGGAQLDTNSRSELGDRLAAAEPSYVAQAPAPIPQAQGNATAASQRAEELRGAAAAPRLTQADKPLSPELVLAALNALRADPASFVPKLQALLKTPEGKDRYVGKRFYPAGDGGEAPPIVTIEGAAAVHDAITALGSAASADPISMVEGMTTAAADHYADISSGTGRMAHTGADGSKPAERMSKYGSWQGTAGEVIGYSVHPASAEELILNIIVSDGEKSRHDRRAILNPKFKVAGIATGPHPTYSSTAVVCLAGGFGDFTLGDLGEEAEATCAGTEPMSPEFTQILDSVPIEDLVDQLKSELAAGSTLTLKFTPGCLHVNATDARGAKEEYDVEWEVEASRRAPAVPVSREL